MGDMFHDLGHTKIDLSRVDRQGLDEVIFGVTKPVKQIEEIIVSMVRESGRALVTGIDKEKANYLLETITNAQWDEVSKVLSVGYCPKREGVGKVHLVSGGTSDEFVVRETEKTLAFFGYEYEIFADVGVAGIHRLMSCIEDVRNCQVIIAFAGMEGALPSVLAGLVDVPVVAVPTSVGSGISKGGRVAMESMLSSCSPGIAVVNVDNGFGAAMFAAKMLNQMRKA